MQLNVLMSWACATAMSIPLPAAAPVAGPAAKCETAPPPGAPYLCDNIRLGPAELPKDRPVAALVKGYDPLGPKLKDKAFLKAHSYLQGSKFRWKYPPFDGFLVHRVNGEDYPLKKPRVLKPGTFLDRFGPPSGRYLSPAGGSFASRSLPPDALNTPQGGPPHNYYCYKVTSGFTADYGPVAAAFEQPGGSAQYHLAYDPADPSRPARTRVEDLAKDSKYLALQADPKACATR
ncbi:TNT domain-containing protein [Streptomyces sp. NPDC021093]|uniref:TNT domain-containing protein n=1 Tax=Streptomyces sp. NPDC021093 TaxID=3365112 RepID=UPI00378CFA3D